MKEVIFQCIVGSHLYGLNHANSDIDTKGIYLDSIPNILINDVTEFISDDKNDNVYFELSKFVKLLHKSDLNTIELLHIPNNMIIKNHFYFQLFQEHKDSFLSKELLNSMVKYAHSQINKARGLNKKISLEKENRAVEKPILSNYCYVADDNNKTYTLSEYLKINYNISDLKNIGLSKLNHFNNTYSVYVKGYPGLENCKLNGLYESDSHNNLKMSQIPKDVKSQFIMYYNEYEYSKNCKLYKEYCDWLKKRNVFRYNNNLKYDYDVKNMSHCFRILLTAKKLANTGKYIIQLDDDEKEFILKIKNGEFEYSDLIKISDEYLKDINDCKCNLQEKIDHDLINNIFLKIRKLQNDDYCKNQN